MAAHKLSILVSAIGAAKAAKELKGVDAAVSRIGSAGGKGIRNLTANLAKLGAVAAVGIGVAVKGGLESLAELESAVTSVDGAITQLGLTGKLTGAQVATWANEIESATDAAFDDKAITAGAGALIRYGKVTEDNLLPAMQVMTDLAAKTGDVDSAATMLAKALADPAKAAGKLAKTGVVLTESQKKQLTAATSLNKAEKKHYQELTKSNKAKAEQYKAGRLAAKQGAAQKILLDALTGTTKGAAAALNGPYKDALNTSADAVEDAQKALAEGFLPVIAKAATWLKTKLADPKVTQGIRDLGNSLAGILDKGLDFATSIPWDKVRDAAGALGTGAKMALDAFLAMPSWVQTAVVGGWGLNKLTGGALGDIAGELGKGLIKGVLGMNAGVVNVKAGVVNGAGGGVTGAAAGGKAGIIGKIGSAVMKVAIVGIAAEAALALWGVKEEQTTRNKGQISALESQGASFEATASTKEIQASLAGIESYSKGLLNSLTPEAIAYQLNIDGVRTAIEQQMESLRGQLRIQTTDQRSELGRIAQLQGTTNAKLATIANKPPQHINVPVTVKVNMSVRDVTRQIVTVGRYSGKTVPV